MKTLRTLFLIAGIIATTHMILCAIVLAAHFVGFTIIAPNEAFAMMFFSFVAALWFFLVYEDAQR